ncbi:MAG TPA: hypothetical protein GXX35_08095 [Thermoanaerobacterales bacterium]|nr:hypothetical protein [Thermoanaerobacterales bacterium]
MIFKTILLILILGLSVFLLGYAIGRRIGKKEGFSEGEAIIPMELKRKLMENGICPLCHQDCNFLKISPKI